MMQYNNQPIVGVCGLDDDRAESWLWHSVWGGALALFWPLNKQQKNKQSKIWHDLRCRHSMTEQTTTNQKHVGAMERVHEMRCNQGGARRGDDTIVLRGIRS
jgi:hypothetical protein